MEIYDFEPIFQTLSWISYFHYWVFTAMLIRFRKVEPFNAPFFQLSLSGGIADQVSLPLVVIPYNYG